MKIIILDVREGQCEATHKQGEVAVIRMDDQGGTVVLSFKALIELARLKAKQEQNTADASA